MVRDNAVSVSVIVVTYNSRDHIGGLLESLRSARTDGLLTLVVVDNASVDGTLDALRSVTSAPGAPATVVVDMGRNAGYAAGMNAGMREAGDSDYVLLLNPDIRLRPGALHSMLVEAQETGAGIVVPRLVDADGSLRFSLRREPSVLRAWGEAVLGGRFAGRFPWLGEMEMRPEVYDNAVEPDWATGAAMLISRQCSAAVGCWDESFFLYSEETDFALRARDAGFVLRYTPDAEAVHFEGDSHRSAALYSLLVRNRVKLFRARNGPVRTALFRSGLFVGVVIRSADPTRRAAAWALLGRTSVSAGPV
jgi:N-acetylglucosaminyl-diphospho-decaprenol L-rhamnosyltransferase